MIEEDRFEVKVENRNQQTTTKYILTVSFRNAVDIQPMKQWYLSIRPDSDINSYHSLWTPLGPVFTISYYMIALLNSLNVEHFNNLSRNIMFESLPDRN